MKLVLGNIIPSLTRPVNWPNTHRRQRRRWKQQQQQ